MSAKENFSTQEWNLLQRALLDAGRYIVMADPRSQADVTRGARAIDQFYAELRDRATRLGLDNSLLAALLTDTSSQPPLEQAPLPQPGSKEFEDLRRHTLDNIKQAAALLAAKATPEEAKDIKIKMYQLAGETAAASKQGSFMGFGGTRVTDAEKAALNELSDALGIDPADAAETWALPGEE